ncbi:MAG: hypothetical protein Alpg2KO_02080 [Alphaproteobacteria bacterium]
MIATGPNIKLSELIVDESAPDGDYDAQLKAYQKRLKKVSMAFRRGNDRAVIVLEGWDAAGKGGLIRRMGWALDPRQLKVWPIAAPTKAELDQHYLNRFWQRLPPRRSIACFDRSWYGRVLVERVEGYARHGEWQRAYHEINEFERLLADDGVAMIKLFLHITPEEQLRRFKARYDEPVKRWKLTHDDFRNRAKWPAYEAAIDDMIAKTSTDIAPWHVIASTNKKRARLEALDVILTALEADCDLSIPEMKPDLAELAEQHFSELEE